MVVEKVPRWESELWSYVSSGDGERCPFYDDCHIRQTGQWCPDDNKERLAQLENETQFELSKYNSIECGTCGGIFRLVEMLSQRWLKKARVHCPPVPNEIVSLVDERYPVEIRPLPLKAYHGAIWCLSDSWIIQVRNDDTPAVQRFTLFHEAFHILAHCKTNPVFSKTGTNEGTFNEMLADYFATCILMPTAWIKKKWAEVKDLDRMAEIFDVPKSAMCIRLKRLGLL